MTKEFNNIHLIGIGGINVSAIAKLLLSQKKNVTGFDLVESDITRELSSLGAQISIEEKTELSEKVDLIIFSEAVPEDDKQRAEAKFKNIKQISAFEFWGEFAKEKKVIAVSGTNGKSSTTAILGLILEEAGLDPTVVVGTKVLGWGSQPKDGQPLADNILIGSSEWLVIEADEYHAHMLEFNPFIAVITNISADHLDFYKDIKDIQNHFQKWVNQINPKGTLVINKDDKISSELKTNLQIKEFGIDGLKGIRSSALTVEPRCKNKLGFTKFNIFDEEQNFGKVEFHVPGEFNVANCLAAVAVASILNIGPKKIIKSLEKFKGTWRRFEFVGKYNEADIISDYAHHPEAIKATLKGAREWYPAGKIIVLFEPHQHNRTKNLFDDFVQAFDEADEVIISEIHDVAGREEREDQSVSSRHLVEAIASNHSNPDRITYAPDLASAEQMLQEKIQPEDAVIIMGAGNVDRVARNLVK